MSDELLPYYQNELNFLFASGKEFREKHPKIANRLRLGDDGGRDPHVERIVQAFAYLSARIRHKLDDDFPEVIESLLGVLYPHYQSPIPSMTIVELQLDPSQASRTTGYTLERGALLDSDPVDDERCRFRTCYPATAWPFEITSTKLIGRPFRAPETRKAAQAGAVLKLELRTLDPGVTFDKMSIDTLRFYLHGGHSRNAFALYELLFNSNLLEVAVCSSASDPEPTLLPPSCLTPVGFGRNEGMFPYSARSFLGYRLLSEYFAFPEKFLFCDLTGLDSRALSRIAGSLEIYLFLKRSSTDLERTVSKDTLRLGCAPAVNLFPQRADPFRLTQRQTEYRLLPDPRRPGALEVYSVDRVEAISPLNESRDFLPFYSFQHAVDGAEQQTFWQATRKRNPADPGTEVYLQLMDLGMHPAALPDWTINVETTCLNRDLPNGGGFPHFEPAEGRGAIADIVCLKEPTPTLRPPLGHGMRWRLLSHLSLNHLSLAQGDGSLAAGVDGTDALREILKLYAVVRNQETQQIDPEAQKIIEGILKVTSRRAVGRSAGAKGVFCQGVRVELELDEGGFSGSGVYLFASVLDRFFGLYASINSFTRLVAKVKHGRRQEETWQWPDRVGEKTLL